MKSNPEFSNSDANKDTKVTLVEELLNVIFTDF